MSTYRCPKHDFLFETVSDHRAPDQSEPVLDPKDSSIILHPAHPEGGHTECPKCVQDEKDAQAAAFETGKAKVAELFNLTQKAEALERQQHELEAKKRAEEEEKQRQAAEAQRVQDEADKARLRRLLAEIQAEAPKAPLQTPQPRA